MIEATSPPSNAERLKPILIFGLMAAVLALRILQLFSAVSSPLSYQPGPDEDYYLRFGQAVAEGLGGASPEFNFMDPGYGYLLGAVFKVAGVNLFAVYLLQALLDTATAYGVLVIGRLLGRPRAGLYGAILYGVTSTAIMFCTTLLKEICVASYVTWWVAGALALIRSDRKLAWLGFGVLCGLGIALRSTLLALGLLAFLLPGLSRSPGVPSAAPSVPGPAGRGVGRSRTIAAALIACGMLLSLLPWALRNYHAYGGLSPLPHNGGIVLHQIYNEQNPESAIWIPPFVNYSHPSEIWRGYAAEASRREGRALSPPEVDRYWRGQALTYMKEHPAEVLRGVLHKSLAFLSATEVPNNRFSAEERLFSPVLALLPAPATWLLALGLAGLVWLALEDRRWLIIAAPIFIAWLTMAVFWAEDRFRFHATPLLALCSGFWIDSAVRHLKDVRRWQVPAFVLLAALIAAVSLYLGSLNPPPAIRWDHIVWGYIKMGEIREARELAQRIAQEQPDNGPILEALGYTAAANRQYEEAAQDLERAIALRPRSHVAHSNLARAYLGLGRRAEAAQEAKIAIDLYPSPDYQALLRQIEAE
jgi:tetratricopeptide (TPR) repeat protein